MSLPTSYRVQDPDRCAVCVWLWRVAPYWPRKLYCEPPGCSRTGPDENELSPLGICPKFRREKG